ncbi:MAG: NUDIX hydrolase [Paracoccus sp. (in: a-proteobacteria)]|nr:NUDIX hydrolase [Paracoccus sp. (in: a-proteobacteria)]
MRPRLAVRAAILHDDLLLMVNAYPAGGRALWCLPGGGVEPGQSLPQTVTREVYEECGLRIRPGAPILVNEFHDPGTGFHQVELIFRAALEPGQALPERWDDPARVVHDRRWVSRAALAALPHKPDRLAEAVWGAAAAIYDPLEVILK